jgi:hypothetical protein
MHWVALKMKKPLTINEEKCKQLLFKVALKHAVAPRLISERLLSQEDKEDMLQGLISFETLDCAVAVWKEYGMCNYADGSGKPYEHFRAYVAQGNTQG